jgi:hypothetical protein
MNATHTAAIAKLSTYNVEMIGVTKLNKASFVVSTIEKRHLFDTKWTEVCDYTVSNTGRILRRKIVERIPG